MNAKNAKKQRKDARANGAGLEKSKGIEANPIYTGELADELQRQLDAGLIPEGELEQDIHFTDEVTLIGTAGTDSEAGLAFKHYYSHIRETEAQHIYVGVRRAEALRAVTGLTVRTKYRTYIADLIAALRAAAGHRWFLLRGRNGITRFELSGSVGLDFTFIPEEDSELPSGKCLFDAPSQAAS